MNGLDYRKVRKKIKHEGNEEEKHLFSLGKNILNLVDKLSVANIDKEKKEWSSFYVLKTAFKDNLQRYKGIYSNYFRNVFGAIEEQERQALGYHIH